MWLGDQSLDGCWFDAILRNGTIVFFTVNWIRTDLPTLRFGGDNYSLDGLPTGGHQTDTVVINWPVISYTSTSQRYKQNNPLTPSYGQLRLEENPAGPPYHWSGLFVDVFEGVFYQFEGWRVEDPLLLKDLCNPEKRSALIPVLAKKYFHRHLKANMH